MGLRHFVLVRNHGQPTTLCDAADIQPTINQALHQERVTASARVGNHRRNYRGSLTGVATPSSTAMMLLTYQYSITEVARALDPDTRPRASHATSWTRSDGKPVSRTCPRGLPRAEQGIPPRGSPPCLTGAPVSLPGGTGLRRKQLGRARKLLASRHYQLLSGHAAIGSLLHDQMSEPRRLSSDERWRCNSGKRQTRYHLFTECRAWAPQIRRLWRRIGRDCRWEHRRAPSVRRLWREEATEAVLEYLGDTREAGQGPP